MFGYNDTGMIPDFVHSSHPHDALETVTVPGCGSCLATHQNGFDTKHTSNNLPLIKKGEWVMETIWYSIRSYVDNV